MKGKVKYIVVLILLIISAFIIRKSTLLSTAPKITNIGILGDEEDFKIIKAVTQLKPGDKGYIALSGKRGTKYTIDSSYKRGNNYFKVKRVLTPKKNGDVTFVWTVHKDTVPGTYPIRISNGKKILNLSHTVLR
jgi:hypothetical protein